MEGRKFVVIGGVAGGASTAARLRRINEHDEIIMLERGPHVSFSNCCLPYYLSDVVPKANKLVLLTPEMFWQRYRIQARVNSEVIAINRKEKTVTVRDTQSGELYEESYDKLILSPGAHPIVPDYPGIDEAPVFTIRNVEDIERLKDDLVDNQLKKVTVIGGGFIGMETTENLAEAGYDVTLLQHSDQVMRKVFDADMASILHKVLMDNGVHLKLNAPVKALAKDKVILESGEEVATDAVVIAIGVYPDNELAVQAGLKIGDLGGIQVDTNYLTNDPNIYAIGDAVEVYNSLTHQTERLSLAGPAQRQARAVANHINGKSALNSGYIGSSCVKLFDFNGASTGLTENKIKKAHLPIQYDITYVIPQDSVGLMPDSKPLHFKIIYEVPTKKILGAQAIGQGDACKRVDVVATYIKMGGTLDDLQDAELCYAPPYGTPKDAVNLAGMVANNALMGDFKRIHINEVRPLYEEGGCFIDLREPNEFARGHIKDSLNIPLSEFRDRLNEFPTDRPLYLYCRSGHRSYSAIRALQQLGITDVYNVEGGFLGLSWHEYFLDKNTDRASIVTEYNFN